MYTRRVNATLHHGSTRSSVTYTVYVKAAFCRQTSVINLSSTVISTYAGNILSNNMTMQHSTFHVACIKDKKHLTEFTAF